MPLSTDRVAEASCSHKRKRHGKRVTPLERPLAGPRFDGGTHDARAHVDCGRATQYQKGAGDTVRVAFYEVGLAPTEPSRDSVGLDAAPEALPQVDERKSRVIELRFFEG